MQNQTLITSRPITSRSPSNGNLGMQLSMMLCGMEYPTGQTGSAVLAASPPNLLSTPNLLAVEDRVGNREGLGTVQELLSNS